MAGERLKPLARRLDSMPDYLLIDGHNDLPWAHRKNHNYNLDAAPLDEPRPELHTDLARMKQGGMAGQFWSVFVPSTLTGEEAVTATLEQIDFVHAMVERYPDALALATTAQDVRAAADAGKVASLLGAEGGHSINESLDTLRLLYDRGVRYMTLTHNDNNPWADSATDEPGVGGLNDFGREVVAEMNLLGMMVDLSHVAATTMHAALDASTAPVIFSHSNARAICDVPRNVPDDVLERIPGNGGVVMATFVSKFTVNSIGEWFYNGKVGEEPVCTVDDVVTQIEYLREKVGVEHIGLGGDYDGTDLLPEGMHDVSTYPVLFDALRERGWSESDLDALAGRNVLRVLGEVEDIAARG